MRRAPRKEHPYEPDTATVTTIKEKKPVVVDEVTFPTFSSRVDPQVVRAFKIAAAQRGVKVQVALTEAMDQWASN
jgi:hypothetical protein